MSTLIKIKSQWYFRPFMTTPMSVKDASIFLIFIILDIIIEISINKEGIFIFYYLFEKSKLLKNIFSGNANTPWSLTNTYH